MSENNDTADMSFGRGDNASKGPIIPKSANEALRPEPVPRPPRRSRKARSQLVIFLNFLMTVVVFVTIAAGAIFYYALDSFEKPGPLAANTNFIVRNGAGVNEIASSLERNDIITDSRVFRGMSRIYLKDAVLKAGKYEIRATFTDQFDRQKGKAAAQDALARWQDVAAMVGLFEYEPPLLLEALPLLDDDMDPLDELELPPSG